MKHYDRSGTKTITRASAMTLLALAVSAGSPIPAECSEHPNYHVRRACWLADGCPIPEKVEDQLALFKSVQPNLFARAAAFKGKDNAKVAHRAGEIKRAEEHNAKAALLFEADPEKFEAVRFRPRGWGWIDPTKEVEAYKQAVRCGFMTLQDVLSNSGQDFEDVLTARAKEIDETDALGLVLDTDPAQISGSTGATQPPDAGAATDAGGPPPEMPMQKPTNPPKRVFSLLGTAK